MFQLNEYLRGERSNLTVSLRPIGTDFQLQVRSEIQHVPIGSTIYTELAIRLDRPRATRSTAAAIRKNPRLIFIPNHRVINVSGTIGGFAGNWNRKPGLLELERRIAAKPDAIDFGRLSVLIAGC